MADHKSSLTAVPTGGGPTPRRRLRSSFGFEVVLGAGVLVAMLAATVVVAFFAVFSLRENYVELHDRNVPYAVGIATAALNAKGMANDERGFLISGEREYLEEFDQRLLNARTAFSQASISADDGVQHRAVIEAQTGFEQWVWAAQRQFKTFQAGERQQATKAALGPGRALRKEYEASLAEAQAVATTAIQLQRNSFASSAWIVLLLTMLVVVMAVGVALTVWLARTLNAAVGAVETPEAPAAASPVAPPAGYGRRRS